MPVSRAVTATLPHSDWLLEAHLSDGSVLEVTEDHRFWSITDSAWVELQDLDAADVLLTPDGATVTVDWLDWSAGVTAPAWDLTVDQERNFFVASDATAVPVLAHNAGTGLFCSVTVDADFARNLQPLSRALDDANLADETGESLARLFGDLGEAQQAEFLDSVTALQANVADDADLAERAARMINNASLSPNQTGELLVATSPDRTKLDLHLGQIRRNGNDAADEVVTSAQTGVPFGEPRNPGLVADPDSARAEAGVGEFYQSAGSTVEYLDEVVSDAIRDRVFLDIHGRTPPISGKKPDLLVDGEFRDVYRPDPLVASDSRVARNAADNKFGDGQTQRLDIWLDGRSLDDMESGWIEFVETELGGTDAFAAAYANGGRAPGEVRAIDSATGETLILYSAPDIVAIP